MLDLDLHLHRPLAEMLDPDLLLSKFGFEPALNILKGFIF